MRGGLSGPYMEKCEWELDASFSRFATADQFSGHDLLADRVAAGTSVQEGGVSLSLQGAYALNRKVNFMLDVPYNLWSYWSSITAGSRLKEEVHGFGDTVIGGRMWLFNTEKHPKQNVAIGLGFRLPTGDSNYQVLYPDTKGANIVYRPVHPSIQPGNGALGVRLTAQVFRQFRHFGVYGSGFCLFSLKEQNDTYSSSAARNPSGPLAVASNLRYLSTPDSYLFNGGVSGPIPHLKPFSFLFGGQIAGVPVYNVLTSTIGCRQAGYLVTINPGLAMNTKLATVHR
jgi:hypothetical protein